MPICSLCGENSFKCWEDYHAHHERLHNVITRKQQGKGLKPLNISGRSVRQIVTDAENTWLKPHLVFYSKPVTAIRKDIDVRKEILEIGPYAIPLEGFYE